MSLRIPTELRVQAVLRRCGAEGVPAVVVRRGDVDAGMLFVKVRLLDGTARLVGPAPAGLGQDDGLPRLVQHQPPEGAAEAGAAEAVVDAYMTRQIEFDPDLWLIEIDDRHGRDFADD